MASAFSPSILKKPSLKKVSTDGSQPSCTPQRSQTVRFCTPISPAVPSFDAVSMLKDYIEGRKDDGYKRLLGLRDDPNVNDVFLMELLKQLSRSISILVPKVEEYVDALLSVSWTGRPEHVMQEYFSFLLSLVSAHPYYCNQVARTLVSNFVLDPHITPDVERVHEALGTIIELVPLSRNVVLDALNEGFPYPGAETAIQLIYVRHLLRFTAYCPISTSHVVNTVMARLVILDSRAPREELLKQSETQISGQDDMDESSHDMAIWKASQTLDCMMTLMFEWCADQCGPSSDWERQRGLYNNLYSAFESMILPAADIHHAHFLLFYVCSIRPALHESFADRLWTLFQNPSTPLNIRKSAADYLASFLGKANFVPVKFVTYCLEQVCKWIHSYLDRQMKGVGAALFKLRAHSAFYAACHIPFYVVAARHNDFAGNRKLLASLQQMDLARIVHSHLNPLRYCHATTVRQFAESASHLQVVFCHTIMMSNQRVCLPEETPDTFVMETQYPFERYLLPNSAGYVSALVVDKPIGIGRDDSLYDADQVMEELLAESPRVSSGAALMHHFLA